MLAISRNYEKAICHVCIGDGTSYFFDGNIRVNQGSPLSLTVFHLCIGKLEQMVNTFIKKDDGKKVTIGNIVICSLEDVEKVKSAL